MKVYALLALLSFFSWPHFEGKTLPNSAKLAAETSSPTSIGCADGCKLSHEILGSTTNFTVSVIWGAGSSPGICVPNQQFPAICEIEAPCMFGAYTVVVEGNGPIQWRQDSGQFGDTKDLMGTEKGVYGDAANPTERPCGSGVIQVYFPDDLAGGGPLCTGCV